MDISKNLNFMAYNDPDIVLSYIGQQAGRLDIDNNFNRCAFDWCNLLTWKLLLPVPLAPATLGDACNSADLRSTLPIVQSIRS